MDSLGRNITLPIYNANGTSFHGLELKKFTFDSVVMALGDKITGELYYPSNTLSVNQTEYVVYDGVKYYLINPPTIVKEGMKADNGTAKGMTKYSFTFYHPMFMLYNFPFTDVAVTSSEEKYKSQDKNFFWIGNLVDYVAKLNKNLTGTEWVVEIGNNVPVQDKNKLSEVLSFNDQKIADALKTGYDTWEIPYIIDIIASTDSRYAQGKRFLIRYGLPSQEILVENAQHQLVPYVFQMGQGVGLKNNSRTPKNNKIITRIAGYGSEDNVPFGYPQILWTGNQTWNYTINNSASAPNSYPIYDGIVAGQRVRLIHHPFTRSHLMPTIYADTVNKKVNPYASGYDPTIEIKDYYDAVNDSSWTYPNQIIPYAPSYEIHEFSDIKPELGEKHIVSAEAFDGDAEKKYLTLSEGLDQLMKLSSETNIDVERGVIRLIHDKVESGTSGSGHQEDIRYVFKWSVDVTTDFIYVKFASSNINFEMEIHRTNSFPSAPWDDAMDDDGNYKQSYFNITLPQLDFDIYACAAVTQEMKINMRSGACLGCSFPVEVDWEDYKANFYDSDGNFAPTGSQRDYNKYPDSSAGAITIICKKEIDTFGTLMPNIYQQPKANDKFVILGISLPTSYITNAQLRLDHDMCQYMLDNNVHYFEWPLKFDEFFLANHTNILAQMKPNILVRFNFASEQHELYIKQISVKYGEKPLPQYNITLTDDIEIVLSPIGRVTDEVSSLRVLFGGGGSGSGDVNLDLLSEYFLSKQNDDTAAGMIRFLRGLQVGENFVTGLLGEGGIFRVDDDGTTYIEADKLYVRMRAYFDTVEVKKYLHSGGNRIASKAGVNCSRVEWIDANGEVTNVLEDTVKFRCYFRANGENGREITNDFVVNDLAFCKETNVDNTSIQQHGYWRCVIGVSSSPNDAGEHWIDLSKSDCQSGSNIPLAQDDIIQLGHKTDNTRQGAIVEFVGGEDAPSYQIYQGINSYNLTGKNYVRFGYDSQNNSAQAYIGNPDGSTYLWYHYVTEGGHTTPRLDIKANVQFTSPITHQDTTIEDFAGAVTQSIEDLQTQIDGEIDTWYYSEVPTLNNAPANDWTTDELKNDHLGDLYYDKDTGLAYRFVLDGSTYKWVQIHDDAVAEALRIANEALDTADSKRRVFLTTPTPPYDNGDLWVNAVWPASGADQGSTYNNDILRCQTSKSETQQFSIGDWTLASKYTDDSALTDFVTNTYAQDLANIETQVDAKAETWYQDSDPSSSWNTDDKKAAHVGDIWYNTSANGGKKTYIWRDRGAGQNPRFYWAQQAVPDEVFDDIDGKAAIYVTWGAWVVDGVSQLNEKDLFIPSADVTPTGSSVTYYANKVYRCTNASTPTFQEIRYTDDTTVDYIINSYGNILGISSPTAQNVGEALGFLRQVLGGSTAIDGGLVLTNLIAMKDTASTPNIWGGINGMYKTSETGTTWKGHGIASWYGGAMVDGEVTPSATNQAKSLFRFDGSGYVAGKNISWDASGNVTIQGYSINATTLQMGGSNVATESMLANYVTLATDQTITGAKTFSSAIKIGDIYIGYDSTNNALKVYKMTNGTETTANLYATGAVSAFGSSSGSQQITLNEPLESINNSSMIAPTSSQAGNTLVYNGSTWVYSGGAQLKANTLSINSSLSAYSGTFGSTLSVAGSVTSQSGGFIVNGKDNTYVLLAGGGTKLLSEIGGGGTVTGIKIGTSATEYTPTDGIVTLPAYPSTSGFVTGISVNGGNPIQPSSGVVSLGIYAPTGTGTARQVLLSSGSTTKVPVWTTGEIIRVATSVSGTAGNNTSGTQNRTTWTATTGATALYNGMMVQIKIPVAGVSSVATTLNIDSLGEHPVLLNASTNLTSHLEKGAVLVLSYDSSASSSVYINGTSTTITGCWKFADYGSTYSAGTAAQITAGTNTTNRVWSAKILHEYVEGLGYVTTDENVEINTTNPSSGTWYYPVWYTAASGTGNLNANDGFRYYSLQGTASAVGNTYIQIGNSTASGTAGNKRGYLRIYGTGTYYGQFTGGDSLTDNRTYTLPNATGTLALTSDIPTNNNQLTNGAGYITSSGSCVYAEDANKLDGYHASTSNTPFGTIPVILEGGWMEVGNSFEMHYDNTTGSDFSTRLYCTGNYSNSVALPSASGTLALLSDCVERLNWWNETDTHDVNDLRCGTTFAYSTHGVPSAGTIAAFCSKDQTGYTLQISGSYSGNDLYYRNRNGDNNTWGSWKRVVEASELGSYLPLSGGTITGNLNIHKCLDINRIASDGSIPDNSKVGFEIETYSTYVGLKTYHANSSSAKNFALLNGNVGIGTTSPSAKLHVSGTLWCDHGLISGNLDTTSIKNTSSFCVGNATNDALWFGQMSAGWGFIQSAYYGISGTTSAAHTYPLVLQPIGGNVGIGTTSPSYKLTVNGSIFGTGIYNSSYYYMPGANNTFISTIDQYSNYAPIFGYGQGVYGYDVYYTGRNVHICGGSNWSSQDGINIDATNNIGIGTSSPSYKLDVNGYTSTIRLYLASGVYFEKDSNGVHLVGAGFYSDSFISAFGVSSGGGSSLSLNEPLNGINNAGLSASPSSGSVLVYNGSAWVYSGSSTGSISVSTNISCNGKLDVTGNITAAAGNLVVTSGSAGIGGSVSSSYKLRVYGIGRFNDLAIGENTDVTSSHINACKIEAKNKAIYLVSASNLPIYATNSYSNISDIRLKNIVSNVGSSVEDIANAPIFNFTWRGVESPNVFLGSSAQYWQKHLPHAVTTAPNGYLSMDYSATALAAAVITARKVVTHEDEIASLKRRVKELEDELETLKAA